MGEEGENFLAGAAFAEDQDGDVGAGDERGLLLELAHAFAGTHEGMVFGEGHFLGLVVGGLPLGEGEVLFDDRLDIAGQEGFHDDATHAKADDGFEVLELRRAGEDDNRQMWPGDADGSEQRDGVAGGVQGDQEKVGLLPLLKAGG